MDKENKEPKKKVNQWIITLIAVILVGAVSFFGGMKYQESRMPSFTGRAFQTGDRPGGQFAFSSEGRQTGTSGAMGFRPVSGKIIKKDDTSITVEMEDGSSKIIILAENTNINKTEDGSEDDLSEGVNVTVFGQQNSDGSITAQNIQLGELNF